MKATKRFSHGLDATWTYTHSKELMLGADNDLGGGVVQGLGAEVWPPLVAAEERTGLLLSMTNYNRA